MKIQFSLLTAALLAAAPAAMADARGNALSMLKADFVGKGQATLDRLDADGPITICNRSSNKPPASVGQRLEQDQLARIKYPADGKLLGNWQSGEKIAQSGRGMTWNDKATDAVGGNCYNCHQIGPKELSFGTVGPSLLNYGKLRGNSPEIQKYTYGKIFNAKAFNLCSEMPRFGHVGALTEAQIKDLVALLLDPESPVNK